MQEEGVLEEAEFYNLQELIHLVKDRIRDRDERNRNAQVIINTLKLIRNYQAILSKFLNKLKFVSSSALEYESKVGNFCLKIPIFSYSLRVGEEF